MNISHKNLQKKDSDKNINNDIKNTLINSFKDYLYYFFFEFHLEDFNKNEESKIAQYYYELKKYSGIEYPASLITNYYHSKVITFIHKNKLNQKIQKIYYDKQKILVGIFSNLEKEQNNINNLKNNKNLNL